LRTLDLFDFDFYKKYSMNTKGFTQNLLLNVIALLLNFCQMSNNFDKVLIFFKLSYYPILKINKTSGKTNAIYNFKVDRIKRPISL